MSQGTIAALSIAGFALFMLGYWLGHRSGYWRRHRLAGRDLEQLRQRYRLELEVLGVDGVEDRVRRFQ